MKVEVLNVDGKKVKQIEASIFDSPIRQDIAQKLFEVEKTIQPYASDEKAGKQHSASGVVRHRRHKWKSHYGRGISRIPRKIFWRRGTQFYWIGAEVSSTRGGRRAHPPKAIHFMKFGKINKKEAVIAFKSAIAATGKADYLKKRYATLTDVQVPIIIEKQVLKLKTKEFYEVLKKILGENFELALKKRKVRAGKGTMRGRKYKQSAGLLIVIGKNEDVKVQGVEIMKAEALSISSLYPLGRLTFYTEEAIEELDKLGKRKMDNGKKGLAEPREKSRKNEELADKKLPNKSRTEVKKQ